MKHAKAPPPKYPPKSTLVDLHCRVADWWKKKLKAYARRTGRSMSHIVIDSVRRTMENEALGPELTAKEKEERRSAHLERMSKRRHPQGERKSTPGPSPKRKRKGKRKRPTRIAGKKAGRPIGGAREGRRIGTSRSNMFTA